MSSQCCVIRRLRARAAGALTIAATALAAAIGTFVTAAPARAHPHILANVEVEISYAENSGIAAIRQIWAYDAAYSAFAKRQIDTNRDGQLSDDELAAFAKTQITALAEYGYYTRMESGGAKIEFAEPENYQLRQEASGALTLVFTLPLKTAAAPDKKFVLEIYDPTFFAYFTINDNRAVRLSGAPAGCTLDVLGPQPIDLTKPRSIPAAFWDALNNGNAEAGRQFVNRVSVTCP
jgi:ABC-type uncharacterized transport system substrate-binding protein